MSWRSDKIPILAFPASTLEAAKRTEDGRLKLLVRFLGLLGPQGPLPLSTTEEAYGWLPRDDAFPRFLDLFNNRFLQLFFRAWADAQPVAQADQPARDRFATYLGAAVGLGSPVFHNLDGIADAAKLTYAGLLAPQAKAAGRLEQALTGLFGVKAEITEFVGLWLDLDENEASRLGTANACLGGDILLGRRVYSVTDKIRIRLVAPDLQAYKRFLPTGGTRHPRCGDDRVLRRARTRLGAGNWRCPAGRVAPVRLGEAGRLGWTSWMAPPWSVADDALRADLRLASTSLSPATNRRITEQRTLREHAMAEISLEAVTGKLNRVGYDAFMRGLRQAKAAGNRNLELAHWLLHVAQQDNSDLALTADHYKLDRARLIADLNAAANGFRRKPRPRCRASPTR